MADKIVMGYWDCKYCGTTGIEGVRRDCPNCGHPRDKDTVFYMKSHSHEEIVQSNEYLTEKQAAVKGKGADWECSFCGALNSTLNNSCKSCGHSREEADPDYFQVRAREEAQEAARNPSPAVQPEQKIRTSEKSGLWKKILLIIVILGSVLAAARGCIPHDKTLHILSKTWEYGITVEEFRYMAVSGWNLPADADLDRTASEVHHYNTVLDHYETKTRTYQERVQTGSHTEYSYTNNGDGTFTEHSYSVPDYGYETRTETYQDPVYIQVPVFQTKYYYHQWRWEYARTVKTSGTDSEPYYGETNLSEYERENGTYENYYLIATEKNKDNPKTYTISWDNWFLVETGSDIRVKLTGNRISEIID